MNKENKVIFLDVDGVLNSATTITKVHGCTGIDDVLVDRLKKIVYATGAKIYLVSDWKDDWYKEQDKKYLQNDFANHLDKTFLLHGLTVTDKVISANYCDYERGKLVKEFLSENKVDKYVILDDITFDYRDEGFDANFVHTYSRYGLTEENVLKAIEILS